VVVTDSIIVCSIKFCREDRTVINVGELCLAEELGLGEPTRFESAAQRRVTVTSFWKLRRDQSAGRRRSTSSRGAEEDVKSTSRGEEFQEEFVLYRETIHCSLANGTRLA